MYLANIMTRFRNRVPQSECLIYIAYPMAMPLVMEAELGSSRVRPPLEVYIVARLFLCPDVSVLPWRRMHGGRHCRGGAVGR